MAYRSTHTGNQIDTAVTKVNTKEVVVKFANVEGSPSDNAALDSAFLKPSDKGVANGVASLDSNGKVPTSQMNDAFLGNVKYQGLWNANTNTPELESTPTEGQKGFYWIVSVSGTQFETDFQVGDWIIAGTDSWQKIDNTDAVTSVEGRTGNVTVISDSVGSGITNYTWSANKLTNEFNKKQDELTPIAPLKIEDVTEGSNTYKAISVQYDNSTIKKNGSNQLYADLSSKQDASTAVTHTENTAVGSTTQPVYIASDGTATATTYSLGKSVPSDAVFTDTTYSAFTGADGSSAGTAGLVPQPTATDNTKYLKGDGTWASVDALPSQASQSGKFLTTDGSAASWANIPTEIPTQTGNSGKFLTTNGTSASWADVDKFPSQSGNSGKFLTTDGTDVSWANVSGGSLPSQSGNSGKFLTTDGTDASWATVSGSLPTQTGNSGKFLTTDGTDASWADVDSFPVQSGNSGKFLTTDGTDVSWANVSGALPTQTGQSGKFLTTDGTDASWVTVTPGDTLPSQSGNSGKFLTTNGTTTSWATVSGGGSLPSQTGNAGKYLTTDGTDASWSPVITFRTWS